MNRAYAVAKFLRPVKRPVVAVLRRLNAVVRAIARATHFAQHAIEWGVPPQPEWYDHFLDVNWNWPATGSAMPYERGIFGSLAMRPGAVVLDLCCGDGFNARYVYLYRSASVHAIDFDLDAISYARRTKAAPGLLFEVGDIRTRLPHTKFTNVAWDAAIEHFTETEIADIIGSIKSVLSPGGVLSGYTVIEKSANESHLSHHEREFHDKQDLMKFLVPSFEYACVFETVYPERTNLYFYASDYEDALPFARNNPQFLWAAADHFEA